MSAKTAMLENKTQQNGVYQRSSVKGSVRSFLEICHHPLCFSSDVIHYEIFAVLCLQQLNLKLNWGE